MEIRAIRLEELPQLLELYRHLHRADDALPERAIVDDVWKELMENPRYRYIGAFFDGALMSSCSLAVVPNLTRGARPYGVIENVVTHADHRNRGYGKAVVKQALGHAWSAGCYKVMLLTGRKDAGIRQFYESAGFKGDEKVAFVARPAT